MTHITAFSVVSDRSSKKMMTKDKCIDNNNRKSSHSAVYGFAEQMDR